MPVYVNEKNRERDRKKENFFYTFIFKLNLELYSYIKYITIQSVYHKVIIKTSMNYFSQQFLKKK